MTGLRRHTRRVQWYSTALFSTVLLVACGGADNDPSDSATGAGTATPETTAAVATGEVPTGELGTASISGRVSYDGEAPRLRPLSMDADPLCAAKHSAPVMPEVLALGDDGALGDVLVRVTQGLAGDYAPPATPAVLDQNGCMYAPHVMGLMVGQTLQILNSDGLLHNVHSLSKVNPAFNRAMPGGITEAEFTLNKEEGVFKVKCDVHPWMSAFVAVTTHPFFSVSNATGSYTLSNLPPGTYEVEAWHEKLGVQTSTVTVADGATATADFAFSRPTG